MLPIAASTPADQMILQYQQHLHYTGADRPQQINNSLAVGTDMISKIFTGSADSTKQ